VKLQTWLLAALVACVPGVAHAQGRPPEATPPAAKAIGGLAWLVGGLWVASPNQAVKRIETQYRWSNNHTFIRFSTVFVLASGPQNHYDGSFFYDPDTAGLAMWNMDNTYTLTRGPMTYDGNKLSMWFSEVGDHGEKDAFRVDITRQGADQYAWQVLQQTNGVWKPLFGLTFVRRPLTARVTPC
jgi:hypothetical protein